MNRLSVAHVGHVDTADDRARWLAVSRWLQQNDPPFFNLLRAQEERGEVEHQFIDLNRRPPRDFLLEQQTHDIVITHHLWGEESEGYTIRSGGAAQSEHHTAENWRQRLRATGARYVFLAGGAFNLAHLGGSLPGYEKVAFHGPWYITILRVLPPGPSGVT